MHNARARLLNAAIGRSICMIIKICYDFRWQRVYSVLFDVTVCCDCARCVTYMGRLLYHIDERVIVGISREKFHNTYTKMKIDEF